MRTRILGSMLVVALVLAACGSDDPGDGAADTGDDAPAPAPAPEAGGDLESDIEPGADADAPGEVPPATEDSSGDDAFDEVPESADGDGVDDAPPADADKPAVVIPDEIPTELQRNVLVDGDGPEAENGDTVIVDYVGVRSRDGEEFDASYGREPFPLTLGAGGVIQGWEDGLLGAQAGERVQLDIPSDLAYGPQARGDVIGENEALTFVIDVRAVIPEVTPDEVPTEPGVPLSEGATETTWVDLVEGEGDEITEGDTGLLRYINFRGDNGVAIQTSWIEPQPIPFTSEILPGIFQGLEGLRVGGRRAIIIPPADGFGEEGVPQQGLPAGTDMIFLVELTAVF